MSAAATTTDIHRELRIERTFAADTTDRLRNSLAGLRVRLEGLAGTTALTDEVRGELVGAVAGVDQVGDELTRMLAERVDRRSPRHSSSLLDVAESVVGHWRADLAAVERAVLSDVPRDVAVVMPARELGWVLDAMVAAAVEGRRGSICVRAEVERTHVRVLVASDRPVAGPVRRSIADAGLALAEGLVETFGGRWLAPATEVGGGGILLPRTTPELDGSTAPRS